MSPAAQTSQRSRPHFVWISLEQGMQCRSHYYEYAIDRPLRRADLEGALHEWGATQTQGPGNFHLPDQLDPWLADFVSFEQMYTSGTSTVSSLRGGFSGVPGVLHALAHSPKTQSGATLARTHPTIFEHLEGVGYTLAGFHLFKDVSPEFVIPDPGHGWTDELRALPDPLDSHVNYVAPVLRLENHLREAGEGPHAICIHVFGQLVPAILEVLEAAGITRDNAVIVVAGDHGHPNYDLEGRQWRGAHDFECDELNTHIYCRLSMPGLAPRKISMPCTTLDLVPTLSPALGIDMRLPKRFAPLLGVDLGDVLAGRAPQFERTLRIANRYHAQLRSRVVSLRRDGFRYQYMHPENVYLHDYHRLHGVRALAAENLWRSAGEGLEGPVNIDNSRVGEVLRAFRRERLTLDRAVQRDWLEVLARRCDVDPHWFDRIEAIDPKADDQPAQIAASEAIDVEIRRLAETVMGRAADTMGELKRIVDSQFYYQHLLAELPEAHEGRVAVWDVDGGYDACVGPIRDRIDPRYVVMEDAEGGRQTADGVPIHAPCELETNPVDVVVVCSPAGRLRETVDKIRALDLQHPPMIG